MSHGRQRAGNFLLALTAALLPLFPYGPVYLGLGRRSWGDLGVLGLILAGIAAIALSRGDLRARLADDLRPGSGPGLGWVVLAWGAGVVVATGGLAIGLTRENIIGTVPFLLHVGDLPESLWGGMNQAFDPLYPIRPWLTVAAGWGVFLLLVLAGLAADDVRGRGRAILYGSGTGLCFVSAFAIYQYLTAFRLHPYWVRVNPNVTRAHSTLDDPNALGTYLVLAVAMVAGLAWVEPRARWRRSLLLGGALLGTAAILTTGSRVAWAALPAAAFLVAAYSPELARPRLTRWTRRLLLAALLVLAIHVGLRAVLPAVPPTTVPQSLGERLAQTLDPRTPMRVVLQHREVWWTGALGMMRDHPFAGIGLGRFPRVIGEYRPDAPAAENAHNFWLQVGAETGWPGFLALAVALATVLVVAARGTRADPDDRGVRAGLLVGLLAVLLTQLTGHSLLLPSIQAAVATFLAGGLLMLWRPGPGRTTGEWARRLATLGLMLALLSVPIATVTAHRAVKDPPVLRNHWGYAWGLHAPESDPGGEFRWTAANAVIVARVPRRLNTLELRYARGQRPPEARPVEVDFLIDGTLYSDGSRSDPEWTRLRAPVATDAGATERTLLIRIGVRPPFVPAAVGGSDDRRELGVMLRPPRFFE